MKHLVIGAGEVGKSLFHVLKDHHEMYLKDLEPLEVDDVGVMNICIPYTDTFVDAVASYQHMYQPVITIIHSSVPVGTSRKLGAVHSPIHGKHPHLEDGIRTFVKYVGGEDPQALRFAVQFLEQAGITVRVVGSPEASELSKLLCTTYYGWNIIFQKEVKKICDKLGVLFEEVYGWNHFYNEGYQKLGMGQFTRPLLTHQDGPIGGHCVISNCHLLREDIANYILKKNKEYANSL